MKGREQNSRPFNFWYMRVKYYWQRRARCFRFGAIQIPPILMKALCSLGVIMTWDEAKLFFKFLFGGIGVLTGVATFWLTFDLPQVASKDYVDRKFTIATEASKQTQASLIDTRLQINKMTRQTLEAEKYRLQEQLKKNPDFEIQRRLNDVTSDLEDTNKERSTLQRQKFQ